MSYLETNLKHYNDERNESTQFKTLCRYIQWNDATVNNYPIPHLSTFIEVKPSLDTLR